jgi:hypothetical protein
MSAHVIADQSADGWNVTVTGADSVTVQTHGTEIRIIVDPDDVETTPLNVALAGGGKPASA